MDTHNCLDHCMEVSSTAQSQHIDYIWLKSEVIAHRQTWPSYYREIDQGLGFVIYSQAKATDIGDLNRSSALGKHVRQVVNTVVVVGNLWKTFSACTINGHIWTIGCLSHSYNGGEALQFSQGSSSWSLARIAQIQTFTQHFTHSGIPLLPTVNNFYIYSLIQCVFDIFKTHCKSIFYLNVGDDQIDGNMTAILFSLMKQ